MKIYRSRGKEVNDVFDYYSSNDEKEDEKKSKMNETKKLHDSHSQIMNSLKRKSGNKIPRFYEDEKKINKSENSRSSKKPPQNKFQDFSKVDISNDFDHYSDIAEEPGPSNQKLIYQEEKKIKYLENAPKVKISNLKGKKEDYLNIDLSNYFDNFSEVPEPKPLNQKIINEEEKKIENLQNILKVNEENLDIKQPDFDVFIPINEKPEPINRNLKSKEIPDNLNNAILGLNPDEQLKIERKLKKESEDLKISKKIFKSIIFTEIEIEIEKDLKPILRFLAETKLIEALLTEVFINLISESNEFEEDSQNPISSAMDQNKDVIFSIQNCIITQIVQSALNDLTSKAINNTRKKFCRFEEKIRKRMRIDLKGFVILYRDSEILRDLLRQREEQRDKSGQENEQVKNEIERINQDIEEIINGCGCLENAYRSMAIEGKYLNLRGELFERISANLVKVKPVDLSEFDI